MLEALDVSRRFGRRWAVRRVSTRFEAGRLTLVTGPNGAGKSTLLGLLAGALRPTEGSLLAFGHDLHHHPEPSELRRRVAWLGHRPFLYGELTGAENLAFHRSLFAANGKGPGGAEDRALLERVGLGAAADRPVSTYSRGMVQRLGIARILVQAADAWLLDEPQTGLDREGQSLLAAVLEEAKEAGRCLVVVTHDPAPLLPLVDETRSLEGGRLVPGVA